MHLITILQKVHDRGSRRKCLDVQVLITTLNLLLQHPQTQRHVCNVFYCNHVQLDQLLAYCMRMREYHMKKHSTWVTEKIAQSGQAMAFWKHVCSKLALITTRAMCGRSRLRFIFCSQWIFVLNVLVLDLNYMTFDCCLYISSL